MGVDRIEEEISDVKEKDDHEIDEEINVVGRNKINVKTLCKRGTSSEQSSL